MLLKLKSKKEKKLPREPDQLRSRLPRQVSSNSVIRARRRSLSVSYGRQPGLSADGLEQAGKKIHFVFVYRFVLVSLEREGFLSRASLPDLE